MIHLILTISLLTVLLLVGYRMALGCPVRSLLLALAIVAMMPILDPSLSGLHPSAYALAVGLVYAGAQFALPMLEGRDVIARWQLPHLTIAFAIVRTEGVSYHA